MNYLLTQCGAQVLVDNEDIVALSEYSWRLSPSSKNKHYAATNIKVNGKWRKVYMHHMIVGKCRGRYVDHINGDALDNRRANLRLISPAQNQHNRGKNIDSPKRYKGVRPTPEGKFRMTISKTYSTEEEAALAYNEMAAVLFGEFAYKNEVDKDVL